MDKFTTLRVYEKDKETLLAKHGAPAHIAFHQAINKQCLHPEDQRTYVVAELPAMNEEALTETGERRRIGGFFCAACKMYVFRKSNTLPVAE